jgi:hypothetical protein
VNPDLSTNRDASKADLYFVTIRVDGCWYTNYYFCFDHWQALHLAVADHQKAGHPLPLGTSCIVDGPCHDHACGCGGASGAGFDRALENFRALVGDAHFGVRDECPAGILHDPGNGTGCAALGDCLCNERERGEADPNQPLYWSRHSLLPTLSMEPVWPLSAVLGNLRLPFVRKDYALRATVPQATAAATPTLRIESHERIDRLRLNK